MNKYRRDEGNKKLSWDNHPSNNSCRQNTVIDAGINGRKFEEKQNSLQKFLQDTYQLQKEK